MKLRPLSVNLATFGDILALEGFRLSVSPFISLLQWMSEQAKPPIHLMQALNQMKRDRSWLPTTHRYYESVILIVLRSTCNDVHICLFATTVRQLDSELMQAGRKHQTIRLFVASDHIEVFGVQIAVGRAATRFFGASLPARCPSTT